MKRIGENIRFYRNLRGLTQTALARKVQVAPAYISQIEANQRVPSLKVTRRIADVLGIDMSVLVRETDPRAAEGRLSDSEKLDLLRTLILSIERGVRTPPREDGARVAQGRDVALTELCSEPSYAVFIREFSGPTVFGRESADVTVESHTVLEGRVEVLTSGPGRELWQGDCLSLSGPGDERLRGTEGARVISVYGPRVAVEMLVEEAAEADTARAPVPVHPD
jgi:transcriptional regulator with XRE-family HTH domain